MRTEVEVIEGGRHSEGAATGRTTWWGLSWPLSWHADVVPTRQKYAAVAETKRPARVSLRGVSGRAYNLMGHKCTA